jgi:Protein of unknown function, DUF488
MRGIGNPVYTIGHSTHSMEAFVALLRKTRLDAIASAAFREGLRRVHAGSLRMRLALMCAESDPLECHRGILVSRFLVTHGAQVLHIQGDGRIESHREAEQRLRRVMTLTEPDLFRTEDQILADAYERREARIAYVEPNVTTEEGRHSENLYNRVH